MLLRPFALALLLAAPALAGDPLPTPNPDFKPDPASVRRFGPAYRYPQDGWIVLHIEGAPYERGFQHGKLMAIEVAAYAEALAKSRSVTDPSAAWGETRRLVNALFLRKYDPEYLEEMKGIADGATSAGAKVFGRAVDLVDVAAVNSELETSCLDGALEALPTGLEGKTFAEPKAARPKPEQAEHCSAFAATGPATADGKIVFGHITMFSLYSVRHFNVWLDVKPDKGHRVLMQTYPGGIQSGMDYYQNDHGLLVTETTIGQTKFGENAAPLASRIRKVMQYANSIDDAVTMLKDANNGLYTNEWLLGDTNTNEIAMFELGTKSTKLWRSSKDEWPGGTKGFYWGCNNTKDLEVRLETVASVGGKPANVTFRPSDRDRKWVELYEKHKGKIGPAFGFEAFTTPPLAAFPSCDAKFTTTAMAKDLKCFALFGPPRGRTWEPTDWERSHYHDIKPLVSNDWTILKPDGPAPPSGDAKEAIDLAGEGDKISEPAPEAHLIRPPAWHGTILPGDDKDLWLAAAFSDYEKIVALERALKGKDGKLSKEAQVQIDLALFAQRERYRSAVRRLGKDVSIRAVNADMANSERLDIAAGKGVLFLAEMRTTLDSGYGDRFVPMMDAFGRSHAGKAATTAEFLAAGKATAMKGTARPMGDGNRFEAMAAAWLDGTGLPSQDGADWSIDAFDCEPDKAIIVYGTLRDVSAQREAAMILQDRIARRWGNYTVAIKSDRDVTDDEMKANHLLVIGRPETNKVAARFADALPIPFGPASFKVGEATYAHAGTAIVAAGANPLAPSRYSLVVFAGLGAESTRECVGKLFDRGSTPAPAVLMPAGGSPRPILIAPKAKPANVAGREE
jgi:Phospholipase B